MKQNFYEVSGVREPDGKITMRAKDIAKAMYDKEYPTEKKGEVIHFPNTPKNKENTNKKEENERKYLAYEDLSFRELADYILSNLEILIDDGREVISKKNGRGKRR